jgi:ABC-type antimicrobial peptide transport system permease subunit
MISRDFLAIALGNLWRLKLRSTLTITGVMVGIGALVSMLSFGNGMQKNVAGEFQKMGLMRTMQVFSGPVPGEHAGHRDDSDPDDGPREPGPHGGSAGPDRRHSPGSAPDSSAAAVKGPPLDQSAIEKIAALEGVALVYPQESFDAKIEWDRRVENAKVQALPASFTRQRPFGEIRGRFFASDSTNEAVISTKWLKGRGIEPDSILGDRITIRATGSGDILMVLAGRELGRIGLPAGITAMIQKLGAAFLPLVLPTSSARVKVVGATDFSSGFGFNMGSVLIPVGTSARIDHLSFSDPYQLLTMLSADTPGGYPMLVVTVTDERVYQQVRGRIEAMGFHVFSFLDQFDQIRKSFLIFDALVGAIGFLALFIASLSIVNTMVMSIVERTREIGILKSLGAEEGEIRALFLIESAAIGLIGSVAGLLLGYGVSRIGALIVRRIMLAQGGPDIDPFSLSVWIALGSVAFGVGLSLVAGLYPAARAARVDPVQALRQE